MESNKKLEKAVKTIFFLGILAILAWVQAGALYLYGVL